VDFFPAGLYTYVPAGHDSSFPLFHNGGRALPLFSGPFQHQWSDWRARIEYCIRGKWNNPEIKTSERNYVSGFITRVKKNRKVEVVACMYGGEINIDVSHFLEDLSGDPMLQFPAGSKAEFVELYIDLSDYKIRNLDGSGCASGGCF
jgi:hypothetical protein